MRLLNGLQLPRRDHTHRSWWDEPCSRSSDFSAGAQSRQGGEDLLSHETSHQWQRSKLWPAEWVISAQAVQIRYSSQEILFGHVGGRKCGTVVWGKNSVSARRAVLWSKTRGQRKLRIWRFGQGVWKTSAAIHHTAPANTMCRSGLPLAAVLLCQCFFFDVLQ